MKKYNLFVYGTLLLTDLQRALLGRQPDQRRATLSGYSRYRVKGQPYPAAVPEPSGTIHGKVLFELTEEELKRLDQYEGEEYKRVPVRVTLEDGTETEALVYIYKEQYYEDIEYHKWHPAEHADC